jgi:hypothetical protein
LEKKKKRRAASLLSIMWECVASYAVQVSTHLAMLSTFYVTMRLGWYTIGMVGGLTLLTSLLYHIAEVMNHPYCFHWKPNPYAKVLILGMDDGRWHVLDNVFAIVSLQFLCVHLADIRQSRASVLQWLGLGLTLIAQQRNPWDLLNTIYPIIPYVVLLFGCFVGSSPRLFRRSFSLGVLCMVPAVFCFYKGLDDDRDYLRIWHGLWHVSINAAAACFMLARGPAPKMVEVDNNKEN